MSYVPRIVLPVLFCVSAMLFLSGCDDSSSSSSTGATTSGSTTTGNSPTSSGSAPATSSAGTAIATVTWVTPTVAANAVAGLELLGYHIYYGTSPGALTHTAEVTDPTATSYEIKNLNSGMWYFAVSAYNADEAESARSTTVGAML